MMANIAAALYGHLVRRRRRALLLELDDHLLADIGLTRDDLRGSKQPLSVASIRG